MSRFNKIWRWRQAREQEIDEELRFHIDLQIELNLAAGMTPEDARAAALRQFGNVALFKEGYRETRMSKLECTLETLLQDAHYGFRMLLKRPGFTVIAVLKLAVGFGGNNVIFRVFIHVLVRSVLLWVTERFLSVV